MKQGKTYFGSRAALILTIALLLIIWGQSLLPVKASAAESGWLRTAVIDPLLALFGLGPVGDYFVRKLAHFTEFLLLGLSSTLLWRGKVLRALQTAFLAAFLDETIQLFSDRSAQISDVWLDLFGAAVGCCLCWLALKLKAKKQNQAN